MGYSCKLFLQTTQFKMKYTLLGSSSDNQDVITHMTLSTMPTEKDDDCCRTCPICVEDFDKAQLEFLPPNTSFVEDRPELCVATLEECGHSFFPLAILFHMLVSGMQCPMCRAGSKDNMLKDECIPAHVANKFQVLPPFLLWQNSPSWVKPGCLLHRPVMKMLLTHVCKKCRPRHVP